MKVVVTKAFPGVPDGETQTRTITVDEIITGDLARVALAQRWGSEVKDEPVKDDPPPDPKPHDKLTVDELKSLAAEKGVDLSAAKTKAEIIAALEAAAKA